MEKTRQTNLVGDLLESFVNWIVKSPKQFLAFSLFVALAYVNIYIAIISYVLFNVLFRFLTIRPIKVLWILIITGMLCYASFFLYSPNRKETDLFSSGNSRVFLLPDGKGGYKTLSKSPDLSLKEKMNRIYEDVKNDNAKFFLSAFKGKYYFNQSLYFLFLIFSFGLLGSFFFLLIYLIRKNSHVENLKRIQKGKLKSQKLLSRDRAIRKLRAMQNTMAISLQTGNKVNLTDKQLNQIVMIVGTTGAGKTVTLTNLYCQSIVKKTPLIIVDGKPDENNIANLHHYAKSIGVPFYAFNTLDRQHYNFLSHGSPTELKDKIMSLKDEWSSDHYRSMSAAYLQTAISVLLEQKESLSAFDLIDILDPDELLSQKRYIKSESIHKKIDQAIDGIDKDDLKGLKAHLGELVYSDLGQYLTCEQGFSLYDTISQSAVVYFALPALIYPDFAKMLGKLIINDIKSILFKQQKKVVCCFDEFSVFAGEQVLNLINQGRGLGAHTVFGTQGFADLEASSPVFKKQLLNCVNTMIVHRINDHDTAEECAAWIGTKEGFGLTSQIDVDNLSGGVGSIRETREFFVHPDTLKQSLLAGEGFLCTKVGGFSCEKILVKEV